MSDMNSTPFISTPLSSDSEYTQEIAMPFSSAQAASVPMISDELEGLYPEIYREVYPLVVDAVSKMMADGYTPTPDTISAIVDNIIRNSGLWYEDEDDDRLGMNSEMAVQFGFGRMPFQRRRRRHHNRDTLRDIIRILLLRELLSKRQSSSYYLY